MRWWLVVLSLLPVLLGAHEEIPDIYAAKEEDLSTQENFFLTATDYKIAPKVNPITGEYSEEEVDFVVAGAQPISVRRFYNHFAPYDPRCASWRYNPECFAVANFELNGPEIFAAVGEADGSISTFKRSSNYTTFHFDTPKGFTTFSSGQSHPANIKINYAKRGDPEDRNRFEYFGQITDGSGRERIFKSPMHSWLHFVRKTETRGGIFGGSQKRYRIQPITWTPYQLPILEERLPNGNILTYTYTTWKKGDKKYPRPSLLSSITAYNADKSKVLGSVTLNYPRFKETEVAGIEIIGSDHRRAKINHISIDPILLSSVERPSESIAYGYQGRELCCVQRPEGRLFTTEYRNGKVAAQYAPLGPRGELFPIAKYEYRKQETAVIDAEGYRTIYRYDENKKMTAVEIYEGSSLYRADRYIWDGAGNLLSKTVEDGLGNRLEITEYRYDKNQNPIEEKIGDGKEWRTISRTFSDDGFNLVLSESDREGKVTCYSYLPRTNLLASELTYMGTTLCKRAFHFYDDCAIRIRSIVDDGCATAPSDLHGVTFRKITDIKPKQTLPCLGLAESVLEKTIDASGREILLGRVDFTYTPFGKVLSEDHYDAEGRYAYSIHNTYDQKERLISTTDALGYCTEFGYDANNNLIAIVGPKSGQRKEIFYDKVNRPLKITDRQADGSLLTTEKKYDKLGRVIEEIDACKKSTYFEYDALGRVRAVRYPDGATLRREYDLFGNVIREIDPEGYETRKSYSVFGQPLSIFHPDGSEEHFVYNPTGTLREYTDKNGTKTLYTYDSFDHPVKSETLFKTTSATFTPFHQLSATDGEGVTTSWIYDFAGRKIGEKRGYCEIFYSYDSLGRLSVTQEEQTRVLEDYDSKNRVVSKKTLNGSKLQAHEEYDYDEADNRTHVRHSQGTTEILFNTYGKPLSTKDPLGFVTHFSYSYTDVLTTTTTHPQGCQTVSICDDRGREVLSLKKDPQGEIIQKTESRYNKNGQRTALTHTVFCAGRQCASITHLFEYGPMGRLERQLEAGTKETRYLYDARGRLHRIIKADGAELVHEYDDFGRLKRYYGRDFDYRYTYDRCDRLLTVEDKFTKTVIRRSYDALGCLLTETFGNGIKLTSGYDNRGRRISLKLPDTTTIEYTYDGVYLRSVCTKGYKHVYSERNLEGQVTQAILPSGLGQIGIRRDALGRCVSLSTPCYKESSVYDAAGNLTAYRYSDIKGDMECSFAYDALDQLTEENTHTYLCDSLHNRRKKDASEYTVNDLCQVTNDGARNYKYDLRGNLIFDGTRTYGYDTLDRLTSIERDGSRIEYFYDAFHRRLSRRVTLDDELITFECYLWDGDHEIGAFDDDGEISELRVLGEGPGAEIGASVLCRFQGEFYVPIHSRGSLVALIDVRSHRPIDCYRYTAFGEEEFCVGGRSPWRFSGKRKDFETGLLFFGRRYYHPALGRWLTQDPEGFDNGPNLYAYVANCPLTRIDLFGLYACEDHSWAAYNPRDILDNIAKYSCPKPHRNYWAFDSFFKNQSSLFSLNDFGYQFPEMEQGRMLFGNGVGNTLSDVKEKALLISNFSGHNTHGVYNASNGLLVDAHEALLNIYNHTLTTPAFLYHQQWNKYFAKYPKGPPLWQGGHSQAAAQIRNALETYPKEKRDRIIVGVFAPCAYISPDLCMQVTHYVCDSDPITYLDPKGRQKYAETIVHIKRDPRSKQSCHEFLNPIYLPHIKYEIEQYKDFIKNYGY